MVYSNNHEEKNSILTNRLDDGGTYMKKWIALSVVLSMTVCLFAGCGGGKTEAPAPTTAPAPDPVETAAPTPDVPELRPVSQHDGAAKYPGRCRSGAGQA